MADPNRLAKYLAALGIICISLFTAAKSQSADTVIYGMNAYNRADIIEINLTDKTHQQVGDLLFDTQAGDQHSSTGFVYYFEWTESGNRFAYWNPATGQNTIVRTYDPAPGLVVKRMAFAPDGSTLYIMDNQDMLHIIDPSTGDITLVGHVEGLQSAGPIHSGDMAFAPDGTLYLNMGDSLFSVDTQTLTATLLYTDMLPGGLTQVWTGLAYCEGLLYASDILIGSGNSIIYSISPTTGSVNQLFSTQTLLNDMSSCPASLNPPVNHPPVLDPIGDKLIQEGETLAFTVTASDPDGDNVTFSADMLPPGAIFDPDTQAFSWITTFGDHGVYPGVKVTVTDDDPDEPLSATEAFSITVTEELPDIVVFADSFESGLVNWETDAQNDWYFSTQRAVDGSFSAEVDGRAIDAQLISAPINLQGNTSAIITFSWLIERGLDRGEYLAFDVSTDDGLTWVELERLRGNVDQENVWHDVAVELGNLTGLKLRFRARMSSFNEDANLDWVTVTAR